MNKLTEQLIALGGMFTSSSLVHDIATTNKSAINETFNQETINATTCLINSLAVVNPATTLDVFGGDIANIKLGMRKLALNMQNSGQDPSLKTLSYYSFAMTKLENMLVKRNDLISKISSKLPYIENQCENFGALHDNVISTCAELYLQTLSTLPYRIRIVGTYKHLKDTTNANLIRTLLLTGVRCAMLWRQLGGNRWQLLFKRKLILQELNNLLA